MKNEDRRYKRKPYKEKEQRKKAVFFSLLLLFSTVFYSSLSCVFLSLPAFSFSATVPSYFTVSLSLFVSIIIFFLSVVPALYLSAFCPQFLFCALFISHFVVFSYFVLFSFFIFIPFPLIFSLLVTAYFPSVYFISLSVLTLLIPFYYGYNETVVTPSTTTMYLEIRNRLHVSVLNNVSSECVQKFKKVKFL